MVLQGMRRQNPFSRATRQYRDGPDGATDTDKGCRIDKTKSRLAEESGIQSSLTEDDMKSYLEQVINEVKKDRQQSVS